MPGVQGWGSISGHVFVRDKDQAVVRLVEASGTSSFYATSTTRLTGPVVPTNYLLNQSVPEFRTSTSSLAVTVTRQMPLGDNAVDTNRPIVFY
ncbi:hypothetical protein BaRGS_00026797 [Batillaria attramentaria]|uniref:Uncharacterized protein n=1 Tax=Batillaria attramentaria TaxID=370345 RepID=A0ABD0K4K7_9CAEN